MKKQISLNKKTTSRTGLDLRRDALEVHRVLAAKGPLTMKQLEAAFPGMAPRAVSYSVYRARDLRLIRKVPFGTAWMAVTRDRKETPPPEVAPPKPKTNGSTKERDDGYDALGPRAQAVYRQVEELNAKDEGGVCFDRDTWLRNAKLEAAEVLIREGSPSVQSIALDLVRSARGV